MLILSWCLSALAARRWPVCVKLCIAEPAQRYLDIRHSCAGLHPGAPKPAMSSRLMWLLQDGHCMLMARDGSVAAQPNAHAYLQASGQWAGSSPDMHHALTLLMQVTLSAGHHHIHLAAQHAWPDCHHCHHRSGLPHKCAAWLIGWGSCSAASCTRSGHAVMLLIALHARDSGPFLRVAAWLSCHRAVQQRC